MKLMDGLRWHSIPVPYIHVHQGRFIELGSAIRVAKREQRMLSISFLLAAEALVSEDKSLLSLFHTL